MATSTRSVDGLRASLTRPLVLRFVFAVEKKPTADGKPEEKIVGEYSA